MPHPNVVIIALAANDSQISKSILLPIAECDFDSVLTESIWTKPELFRQVGAVTVMKYVLFCHMVVFGLSAWFFFATATVYTSNAPALRVGSVCIPVQCSHTFVVPTCCDCGCPQVTLTGYRAHERRVDSFCLIRGVPVGVDDPAGVAYALRRILCIAQRVHRVCVTWYCPSLRNACRFMQQIACGAEHIHNHGIVHGDIKPVCVDVSRQRRRSRAASGRLWNCAG